MCVCECEEMAEDRWHVILPSPLPLRALTCSLDSCLFSELHSPEKFLETSMVVKMAPCGEEGKETGEKGERASFRPRVQMFILYYNINSAQYSPPDKHNTT